MANQFRLTPIQFLRAAPQNPVCFAVDQAGSIVNFQRQKLRFVLVNQVGSNSIQILRAVP